MNTVAAATISTPGNGSAHSPSALPTTPGQKKQLFNGPCYLKMLVSNLVAGSIIGKNGTVISLIESNTNTSMKLSPTNNFFPGTSERIVVISGESEAVHEAMTVVIDKINEVTSAQFGPDSNREARMPRSSELVVKFAIPKSAVSGIIGKAGHQIKQLQEDSKAKIQISNRELGLNERVVTITGTLENIYAAASQIATAIQDDINLKDHMYVTYNSPSSSGNGPAGYGGNMGGGFADYGHYVGAGGPYPYPAATGGYPSGSLGGSPSTISSFAAEMENLQYDACEIQLEIPDSLIGYVKGKGGVYITEIMRAFGVNIKLSAKGDFVPGTQHRKVTIQGMVPAVHRAHARLLLRIKEGSLSPSQNRNVNNPAFGNPNANQYLPGGSNLPSQTRQSAAQHNSYAHPTNIPYGYQGGYSPYL